MKKRLFWFGLGMAALLVLAANRTAILEGLLQSDLDGGGYSGTNFLNVAATNFFGGGAGLSNVSASSVSGTLTNRVAATNVYGGGLLSQSVEDLTQATNEVTRQINSLTNKMAASNVISGGLLSPSVEDLIRATNYTDQATNRAITVQGAAVFLGMSTLAAGSSPSFNGINFTNEGYGLPTNNVGGAAFVFGGPGTAASIYDTNITANTTLKPFDITACGSTAGGMKIHATCSGGTDRTLTFPNGCTGAGYGTPPVITITNGVAPKGAMLDVLYTPGAVPMTNVFWSPIF